MDLDQAIAQVDPHPAAYVLLGSDGKYLYKGSCRNLCERLKDHRAGLASRTKNRRPLSLVHFEYCETYSDALRKERYLKSGHGRAWLERKFKNRTTVPDLRADCPAGPPSRGAG